MHFKSTFLDLFFCTSIYGILAIVTWEKIIIFKAKIDTVGKVLQELPPKFLKQLLNVCGGMRCCRTWWCIVKTLHAILNILSESLHWNYTFAMDFSQKCMRYTKACLLTQKNIQVLCKKLVESTDFQTKNVFKMFHSLTLWKEYYFLHIALVLPFLSCTFQFFFELL